MSLKDFSFAQLDKSARLKVGSVDKSNVAEKANMGRGTCAAARTCTTR